MMAPAAVADPALKTLVPVLERDDVFTNGGNSYYHDDIKTPFLSLPFVQSSWDFSLPSA